jgi:hypothetical protein
MGNRLFDYEYNRVNYGTLLKPENDYELDFAVGMTYSLDLDALLSVPISLGLVEGADSIKKPNPYLMLKSIIESNDKIRKL